METVMTESTADATNKRELSILRLPKVKEITGKGRSSIYADIKKGSFPAPMKLGARSVGWKSTDVYEWINSLPMTRSSDTNWEAKHGL